MRDTPLGREIRESLSLLAMTALAAGAYLGIGLLALRLLG